MTPEESERLRRTEERVDAMYEALFEVPEGSEEKPLITKLNAVVRRADQASWLGTLVIWGLPTAAGLAVALRELWKVFGGQD